MGQGEKRDRSIGKGSKTCPHDPSPFWIFFNGINTIKK